MAVAMAVAAMVSLSACSSNDAGPRTDYDKALNVPIMGWAGGDTLLYTLHVTQPATLQHPLQVGIPYHMRCSIRMTSGFGLTHVPLQLSVQQTDTVAGGHTHVVRNLLRCDVAPQVRDSLGRPLGATWGSLITHEQMLDDISLRFDSAGTYRIIVTPQAEGAQSFYGLSAIGLSLVRER